LRLGPRLSGQAWLAGFALVLYCCISVTLPLATVMRVATRKGCGPSGSMGLALDTTYVSPSTPGDLYGEGRLAVSFGLPLPQQPHDLVAVGAVPRTWFPHSCVVV
jgi:hypothetical protein